MCPAADPRIGTRTGFLVFLEQGTTQRAGNRHRHWEEEQLDSSGRFKLLVNVQNAAPRPVFFSCGQLLKNPTFSARWGGFYNSESCCNTSA